MTTFGDLEMDERYKKLERCLKLALLKKNVHNNIEQSISTWSNISSINANTMDSSCVTPSLQLLGIKNEVIASSNNLKSILPKEQACNTNRRKIATSSIKSSKNIKQDNIDQCIMPPPTVNKLYHASKKIQNRPCTLSERNKSISMPSNNSIESFEINNVPFKNSNTDTRSCISANICSDKEHLHSSIVPETADDLPKLERIFSKWKVMLNDQYQLIIKGTLECGKVARSKSVIRRYSTTCIESIFKHKYHLQGNLTDDRNELPAYIRGKFHNGFPDDWENVYQIWRTFVSQGCPITFRWPTPITDSDDDLKSEVTDQTYICRNNTPMKSYKMIESTAQVIQSKTLHNRSSENIEKYNCTRNTQSHEKYTFIKPSVPMNTQASSADIEKNEQNIETDINQLFSPVKKTNKLKDILQEDKLNIIINNLADRNCSPKYIDKIIEMFDCLDYVMSYRTETERSYNESYEIPKSEAIPLQQILVCNKGNCMNDNELEKRAELKSHSTDLGYGSIKNNTYPSQLNLNMKDSVEAEYDKHEDSDQSESEIYAGIPKISIERVLQAKKASRKLPKRKVRKKTNRSDQQIHAVNDQCDANVKQQFVHLAVPTANFEKKNPFPDESSISITNKEMEMENIRTHREAANVVEESPKATLYSHQLLRTDFNVRTGKTVDPTTRVQCNLHERLHGLFQPQRIQPNFLTKQQKSRGMEEEQLLLTDVDYATNCNVEKNIAANNKSAGVEIHADLCQDDVTILSDESDNDFPEKLYVSRESHKKFIELPKSETAVNKSKPIVVSSIPVNLNLKITKADVHRSAKSHDSDISITDNEDKKKSTITRPTEKTRKVSPKKSITAKPVIVANKSPSKATTTDSMKEDHATSNTDIKNEAHNMNPADAVIPTTTTTRRPKKHENNPKVLTAWAPKVVCHFASKNKLGLSFQGKLLNEVGYVVHRNFTTDIVLRRLSPTLIETVNYELYQLLGPVNENKHVISKELLKQCRNGCPAKIEQFCLMWKSLQQEEVEKKSHDSTMDSLSISISSRGRRILPPLCYWTGERITLKDNTPIYNLGHSQESTSLNESPRKNIKKNKEQQANSGNVSRKNSVAKQLHKTNKVSSMNKNQTIVIDNRYLSAKSSKDKATSNARKSKKSIAHGKQSTAKRLTCSSSDAEYEEEQVSPRKRLRSSRSNTNGDAKVQQSRYSMRKRQKMEGSFSRESCDDTNKSKHNIAHCSPTKKPYEQCMVYAYHQGIPQEDFLSENQASPI
ncbi:uncharacterized protein LOC105186730 isoform X2 [Harpegnathos saltator]|uniref:uncharacterized protein LOC105186730 isoform X2 n=1 Tax=Harpegnathos saltator TaxID=610380 RepID=UPI000DBEEFF3|nr:uncharacterized protein LOC105186730 isoform X2 [Harpegnathos saltator]